MVEEAATTEVRATQLPGLIDYYHQIQEEINRLNISKEMSQQAILKALEALNLRQFDTESGLRAIIFTTMHKYISVTEARKLLDKDTFQKLLSEKTSVVLLVRPLAP